jgi:hypothetical protein
LALFLVGALILAADTLIRLNDELRKLDEARVAQEALREMVKSNALSVGGRILVFIGLFIALVKLIASYG